MPESFGEYLEVGDVDGYPRLPAYAYDLLHGADGVPPVSLVSYVARVEAAVLCGDLRQLDDLLGLGVALGVVPEACGEAEAARLHRLRDLSPHRLQLPGGWGPHLHPHDVPADGAESDEGGDVQGDALLEPPQVLVDGGPVDLDPGLAQPGAPAEELLPHLLVHGGRPSPAAGEDEGGDPLPHLVDRPPLDEQGVV